VFAANPVSARSLEGRHARRPTSRVQSGCSGRRASCDGNRRRIELDLGQFSRRDRIVFSRPVASRRRCRSADRAGRGHRNLGAFIAPASPACSPRNRRKLPLSSMGAIGLLRTMTKAHALD